MTTSASPLLFRWSEPRRIRKSFVAFLIASIVLHAICFSLFQIVYPPTAALLPPPARLAIITGNDSESRALLHWVEAEDPALAMITQPPADTPSLQLPATTQVPSYADYQPELRAARPVMTDLRIPSAAAMWPISVARRGRAAAGPPAPSRTVVSLAEGNETIGQIKAPEFNFHASRAEAPDNARFELAVDEHGAVRHVFQIGSANDRALDEQAAQFLQLCRFPEAATAQGLSWVTVTILWGSDVVPPPKTAEPFAP